MAPDDLEAQAEADALLMSSGLKTNFRDMNLGEVYTVLDYVLGGEGRESVTFGMVQLALTKGYDWRKEAREKYNLESAKAILYLDALARMQEIGEEPERPPIRM